jgi:hypothetical protein
MTFRNLVEAKMFHKSRQGTTRIQLLDMKLVDIPQRQSLFYLKAKQGGTGTTTKKYPIANNTVAFTEPLIFDYSLPSDSQARHPKPLRLSFRFENAANSGFTRYGVCELDVMKLILEGKADIRVLLLECQFNTYFISRLTLPNGSPWPNLLKISPQFTPVDPVSEMLTASVSPPSVRASTRPHRDLSVSVHTVTASSSSSNPQPVSLYDSSPIKVPIEKFQELEHQVDELLAGIINDKQG